MRVLLFAALRELAGAPRLELDPADAADVGGLMDGLCQRFGPEFARIAAAGSVVVNGERASRDRTLGMDDEVALLPPVSGGGAAGTGG